MKNILKKLGILLALSFIVASTSVITPVSAGTTGVLIEDGSVFEGNELAVNDWLFSKNAGIALETYNENPAVAIKTQNVGKLFTSYTKVNLSEDVEDVLNVDMKLSILGLLDGYTFGFTFGSPKLIDEISATGTTFLWFDKSASGFTYGLKRYEETGEKTFISGNSLSAATAADLAVVILVDGNGRFSLDLNGTRVYESAADGEVTAEGFLGFVQEGEESLSDIGKTSVYITDLNIVNQYYERPENPLVMRADFSGNEFNTEEWHINSTSAAPYGGIYVEDGLLRFSGSGQNGCFGTIRKYSNFVLEYDLFDVNNETSIASDGKIISASYWQGVEFGIQGEDVSATYARHETSDYLIYFGSSMNALTGERSSDKTTMGFVVKGKYQPGVVLPDKFSLFRKGFSDKVRVKISVVDGKMNVSMKLAGEFEYTDIYNYEFENGYTPFGYVSLHGEGNQYVSGKTMYCASYFSIDNVLMIDYDEKPNVIKVGFTSNVLKPYTDYNYVNTWSEQYLIVYTKGKGTK